MYFPIFPMRSSSWLWLALVLGVAEGLGREGSEFIDQLAMSVVGGKDGGAMARKGICKQRLQQIISVTSQVAISRRVLRYKLALRDRQARRKEEGRLMLMAWGSHIDAEKGIVRVGGNTVSRGLERFCPGWRRK